MRRSPTWSRASSPRKWTVLRATLVRVHLLVTGFEAFGQMSHNPSAAVLPLLPSVIAGFQLETAVLPVDTRRIREALRSLYARSPAVCIHLGLARDRSVMSLERVALNVLDFPIADNQGEMIEDEAISPGGPLALASRLPLRPILDAWRALGLPAELSNSAGTFLCNQTMYLALELLPPEVPVGFIHLPPDEVLGAALGRPSLRLAELADGVRAALELSAARATART